jgi:hypothetical protein
MKRLISTLSIMLLGVSLYAQLLPPVVVTVKPNMFTTELVLPDINWQTNRTYAMSSIDGDTVVVMTNDSSEITSDKNTLTIITGSGFALETSILTSNGENMKYSMLNGDVGYVEFVSELDTINVYIDFRQGLVRIYAQGWEMIYYSN